MKEKHEFLTAFQILYWVLRVLSLSLPHELFSHQNPWERNLMSQGNVLLKVEALRGGMSWTSMWIRTPALNLVMAKECQWVRPYPRSKASQAIWEVGLPSQIQWQEGFLTSFLPCHWAWGYAKEVQPSNIYRKYPREEVSDLYMPSAQCSGSQPAWTQRGPLVCTFYAEDARFLGTVANMDEGS